MALAPEDMEAIKTMVLELLEAQKAGDETPEEKEAREKQAADEAAAAKAASDEADEEERKRIESGEAGGDEERAAERIEEIVEEVEEAIEEIKEASEDLTKASDSKQRRAAQDRMVKAKDKLAAAKAKHGKLAADSAARKGGAAVVTLARQVEALTRELSALKKPAKDSANFLGLIADRDQLYSRVSHFTGSFDHSRMDSQKVAEYACDKLSIKCAKGTESIALDAWLQGRKPEHETIAKDAKAVVGSALSAWGKE